MIQVLWIRIFYRLFFTIWFASLSPIGAESLAAFYAAVAVGLLIDLLRYKYVPDELTGVKEENFKGEWGFKKPGPFNKSFGSYLKITIYLILYIWIICFLDWIIPSQIMELYFNLFTPLHGIMASQVNLIRDHPMQLIEAGYAHRVPLTLHIYTVAFLGTFSALVYHCCFRVHKLMYTWESDENKSEETGGNKSEPDPLLASNRIILGLIVSFIFWFAMLENSPIEFVPRRKHIYAIHVSNLGFYTQLSLLIFGLNIVMSFTFQRLVATYHRLKQNE